MKRTCAGRPAGCKLRWPAVPDCPGQSRNGTKCPASRAGPFRDNETSRNECF